MTFEILMALSHLLMAGLALFHSLKTRSRGEAWMLLGVGLVFGYVFPPIDINVFHHYTFHGQLTVLNIPFYLGFAWYAFYYLAFSLAEFLLGRDARRLWLALLAALIFGGLEAQWDPTLLEVGAMEMFLPSFGDWPWKFHCGVPMFHAFLCFLYVYGFLVFREAGRMLAGTLVTLAVILGFSLFMMSMVPFTIPMFEEFHGKYDQGVLKALDALHFSTTFAPMGALAAWVLRIAGRRLGKAS